MFLGNAVENVWVNLSAHAEFNSDKTLLARSLPEGLNRKIRAIVQLLVVEEKWVSQENMLVNLGVCDNMQYNWQVYVTFCTSGRDFHLRKWLGIPYAFLTDAISFS